MAFNDLLRQEVLERLFTDTVRCKPLSEMLWGKLQASFMKSNLSTGAELYRLVMAPFLQEFSPECHFIDNEKATPQTLKNQDFSVQVK